MSRQLDIVLRWKDVVVTSGARGQEDVLLAAVDLEVRKGETLWIVAADAPARAALVGVLEGSSRPLYGRVCGVAKAAGAGDRRPVGDDSQTVMQTGFGAPTTIIVSALPPKGSQLAHSHRCLTLTHGALRPGPPT